MLQCPRCSKTTTDIQFTGTVLKAVGVLEFVDGSIKSVGPVRAVQTIAAGAEWDSQDLTLTCPHCKHEGHQNTFAVIVPCYITGKPSQIKVVTNLGTFYVVNDVKDLVARVLVDNPAMLESPIREEDIYV